MPRLENKIAIVDIETTGPNIDEGDRIIQIGAIIISEGKIVNTYSMLINPNRSIPDHIAKLTGINEDDVANAPQFNSVASLWYERLKDCVFVAHNLGFDLRILKESFSKFDLDFNPIALDSVVLAKIIVPTAIGFNLTDLSRHFNLEYTEAHDALSDALITADILSELAHIVTRIPQETLTMMEPFLKHLSYNEFDFFNDPKRFMLKEVMSDVRQPAKKQKVIPVKETMEQTLSDYIAEKWASHPFMVLEDIHYPITYEMVINDSVIKNQPLLISFPSLEESNYWMDILKEELQSQSIALLKSQTSYLHAHAFEKFVASYNFKRNNQQELLVISATIHWLTQSKFGDYSEIHKELSAKPLLEKYQAQDLLSKNHTNYHNAKRHAKDAHIIMTYDMNLTSLMSKNRDIEDLYRRQLIILDINHFIQAARYVGQGNIAISDLNNLLMTLYDDFQYKYKDNQYMLYLSNEITSIRKALNKVISFIGNILTDKKFDSTLQQEKVNHYVEIQSKEAKQIMTSLRKISKRVIEFYNQVAIEDTKVLIQKGTSLQRYIEQLVQITSMGDSNNYLTIQATRVNQKFYGISIQGKPVVIQKNQLNWLNNMKRVLFVSSGNYYNSQMTGDSNWIELDQNFTYVTLPKVFHDNKPIINHPVEFIQASDDGERIQNLITYFEVDKKELGDKIIVLMPNQALVSDLFHQLITNPPLSEEYHIFAESITGSLNRIRRRIYETEKMIVVLRERSFTQLLWGDNQTDITIMLYNLPFQSPSETTIQAKYHYLLQLKENTQLFDDILLPQMVQRLKNVVSFIRKHYTNEKIYLLDKRLYTKYYTKEILKQLENMMDFNIIS